MDDSNTFVSPEGVYTHAEEHRPPLPTPIYTSVSNAPTSASIATRITAVVVNFPALKPSSSQPFSALLGGGKGDKKDKDKKAGHHLTLPAVPDQEESVSSGDAEDGNTNAAGAGAATDVTPTAPEHPPHHPLLFSPPNATAGLQAKKKSVRAKQNLKTTTSSFVSRYHCIEGLHKHFGAKSGETTFIFYNAGKTFHVTETDAGTARHKVCPDNPQPQERETTMHSLTFNAVGSSHSRNVQRMADVSCRQRDHRLIHRHRCHYRLPLGRPRLVRCCSFLSLRRHVRLTSNYGRTPSDPISTRYVRLNKQVSTDLPSHSYTHTFELKLQPLYFRDASPILRAQPSAGCREAETSSSSRTRTGRSWCTTRNEKTTPRSSHQYRQRAHSLRPTHRHQPTALRHRVLRSSRRGLLREGKDTLLTRLPPHLQATLTKVLQQTLSQAGTRWKIFG